MIKIQKQGKIIQNSSTEASEKLPVKKDTKNKAVTNESLVVTND